MVKKYFKKIKDSIKELITYEFKYLLILFLIAIICYMPLNYYIVIGGGISDINSRVSVSNGYKSKGSLNISYVTETDGVLLLYLLSYIMPNWTRESVDDYKYEESDSVEDILFRNQLLLKSASSNATYVAFKKANKKIYLNSSNYYVISKMKEVSNNKLQVGDEILEFNGKSITDTDYVKYLNTFNEGDYINIKIKRKNKEKVIKSKLYKKDDRIIIGVYLSKLDNYKTDKEVKIKFKKSESGPSGGLMTALSIYNQLTKKDITNGLVVAGTGTIDHDGNVGEIGGVEYKLRGAVSGKADVFLVPSGSNYIDAKKLAKKENYKIKIIRVKTFDDAITKLNSLNN